MAWNLLETPLAASAVKRIGRQREYSRVFLLSSTAGETTGFTGARTAAGVPLLGSVFVDPIDGTIDPAAICQDVRAAMVPGTKEGTTWRIECSFASIGAQPRRDEPLDALEDDPEDRPYSIRGRTTHRQKALRRGKFLGAFRLDTGAQVGSALDSRPLATSVGEPLLLTPQYDGGEIEWDVTVNLAEGAWSAAIAAQWKNAINNATWNGLAAYTVRISDITFDRIWEGASESAGGSLYWDVTYHFEVNPDFWYQEFEDVGTRYFNGQADVVQGEAEIYLNGQGEPLEQSEIDNGQFVMLRYLPLDWPLKSFASIPGGPITL